MCGSAASAPVGVAKKKPIGCPNLTSLVSTKAAGIPALKPSKTQPAKFSRPVSFNQMTRNAFSWNNEAR